MIAYELFKQWHNIINPLSCYNLNLNFIAHTNTQTHTHTHTHTHTQISIQTIYRPHSLAVPRRREQQCVRLVSTNSIQCLIVTSPTNTPLCIQNVGWGAGGVLQQL